jgi:hypothetical protein
MKPVPTPGNPWRRCQTCDGPFTPKTEHHRYCCGRCRQQAYRTRHRPLRHCRGCGCNLHVGHDLPEGRRLRDRAKDTTRTTVSTRQQHCSDACMQRTYRWRRDGRLLVCGNPECPRHGFKHNHRYDAENQLWECRGCGQLQPATW